jgi:hypothetical protein
MAADATKVTQWCSSMIGERQTVMNRMIAKTRMTLPPKINTEFIGRSHGCTCSTRVQRLSEAERFAQLFFFIVDGYT